MRFFGRGGEAQPGHRLASVHDASPSRSYDLHGPVMARTVVHGPPMCLHCKLRTVLFHEATGEYVRPSRSFFECPSCSKIVSEPVSYVVKAVQ